MWHSARHSGVPSRGEPVAKAKEYPKSTQSTDITASAPKLISIVFSTARPRTNPP
jgi:hypothetical protein